MKIVDKCSMLTFVGHESDMLALIEQGILQRPSISHPSNWVRSKMR